MGIGKPWCAMGDFNVVLDIFRVMMADLYLIMQPMILVRCYIKVTLVSLKVLVTSFLGPIKGEDMLRL